MNTVAQEEVSMQHTGVACVLCGEELVVRTEGGQTRVVCDCKVDEIEAVEEAVDRTRLRRLRRRTAFGDLLEAAYDVVCDAASSIVDFVSGDE